MLTPRRAFCAASVILIFLSLLFTPVASAQLGLKHKSDQDKEEELQQRAEKRRDEQARKHANLAEFAQDEYTADPDFHDRVDQAYQDLQSQHAMEAFGMTPRTCSRLDRATEDRLRAVAPMKS